MTPLMTLLVLGLLLVVVLALLVWSLVGAAGARRPPTDRADATRRASSRAAVGRDDSARHDAGRPDAGRLDALRERPTPRTGPRSVQRAAAIAADDDHPFRVVPAAQRNNDEHRGAKAARPVPTKPTDDDPFERFLRAGRDDER